MSRSRALLLLAVISSASVVRAEVEKLALSCGESICFHWWPHLPEIKGWHHDRDQSLRYGANALAPDGCTFAHADAVIYARDASLTVRETAATATADGQRLRTFEVVPAVVGNWERVAFGDEGDFYLLFAVSARSEDAYRRAAKTWEELVARYRAKPRSPGGGGSRPAAEPATGRR